METQILSPCKNKIPLEKPKILQDIITQKTNLKFSTQAKNIIFQSKNPGTKIDLLLPRGL
jgi:hypothetical protein